MDTNISCPEGWTEQSELSISRECSVNINADIILKALEIGLAGLIFTIELIVLLSRWSATRSKKQVNQLLIFWTVLENIIIPLRPLFGLIFNLQPATSLWLSFITHITAATMAAIVVIFMYIEIGIRHRGSLGNDAGCLFKYRKPILITIVIITSLLFLIGPLISYFLIIPLYMMFWPPVILFDFTMIPYFDFLTARLYLKIAKMAKTDYRSLSRQLLITGILCGSIGLFTGVVGVYSLIDNRYEWVLIEISWISDTIFNFVFFTVLIRRPVRSKERASSQV